ncbi:MAG TPA: peptide deformylase [Methylomirabilota bacterium]|nr:peptide deformylase [Methylomirabilota bacterium]
MAILKVSRLGHPVLRRSADPVPVNEITHPDVQRFIDEMIETMHEYDGVGLAAPQVHVSRQIAVLEVESHPRYPDMPRIPLTVIVNPVLTPVGEEAVADWEGCLSIPDFRGMVPRHTAVRLEAYGRKGERIELTAKDFFARVLQHETDHLNGKVYLDRMRDFTTLSHLQEWMRYWLKPESAAE